jgi:hypothetical protein
MLQKWTTKILNDTIPYFIHNSPFVCMEKVYSHSSRNWQISADSAESGSNLNYRCFIVCSCFFSKFIFRYTTIYFIRDP